MSAIRKKKTANKSPTKKQTRPLTEEELINKTHRQFAVKLRRLPQTVRESILEQIRDDNLTLSILEQAEFDPSPYPTEEQYQQLFFDATGWYYPDDGYTIEKIKDRF